MRLTLLSKYSFARLAIVIAISLGATTIFGQTTSFTYQGRLTDGGTAANGNYDLQFALFDSLSGGGQVGATQTLNTVAVSNGVFTVNLDFGASAFNGVARFLEISTRPSGGGSFTLLTPRQQITSTPYAVRSLNAASADNVPASGIPAGSGNYIQNGTSQQASSNFNISGNGTIGGTLSGNVVNATAHYNLNGSQILSNAGVNNVFLGADVSTTGSNNAFIGFRAGASNTTGSSNSFFGQEAGFANTNGLANSFFGVGAGKFNTAGTLNAFFGFRAGSSNTLGEHNAYFGPAAGFNGTGSFNTFIGDGADFINISPSGNRNTLLGSNAKILTGGQFSPDNATAIGANAQVDQANSLVLGSINGVNGATANTNVGIGTTAPTARLSVVATGDGARVLHLGTERGWAFKQLGTGAATALELTGDDPNNNNKNFVINTQGNVGISTTNPGAKLDANSTDGTIALLGTGTVRAVTGRLGGISCPAPSSFVGPGAYAVGGCGGTTGSGVMGRTSAGPDFRFAAVYAVSDAGGLIFQGLAGTTSKASIDANGNLSLAGTLSQNSDVRLKQGVATLSYGLREVLQLRPVTWTWKQQPDRGMQLGLIAQEVETVLPNLVTTANDAEQTKGLNYIGLLPVVIKAIQEQQTTITMLQAENTALNARLRDVEKRLRDKSGSVRRHRSLKSARAKRS